MSVARSLKNLYEKDYHLWYVENAKLMREKKFQELDVEHIAEELDSMGRREEDKLESLCIILFLHLLKLKYQSNFEVGVRGWKLSVKEHRMRIEKHLKNNPSLKGVLDEIIVDSYSIARLEAAKETGLTEETFPLSLPFTWEQALQENWLPC